jgi:hypothetical protein
LLALYKVLLDNKDYIKDGKLLHRGILSSCKYISRKIMKAVEIGRPPAQPDLTDMVLAAGGIEIAVVPEGIPRSPVRGLDVDADAELFV